MECAGTQLKTICRKLGLWGCKRRHFLGLIESSLGFVEDAFKDVATREGIHQEVEAAKKKKEKN